MALHSPVTPTNQMILVEQTNSNSTTLTPLSSAMSLAQVTRDSRELYPNIPNRSHKPIVHETTGNLLLLLFLLPLQKKDRRLMCVLGEKLPALINASLTLVPGDGICCFGTLSSITSRTNLPSNRWLRSLHR
jgi:hypothetical protein